MNRTKIIAGNWKMNNTMASAKTLVQELIPLVGGIAATVVVCVPYTNLSTVGTLVKGSNIKLGAQNMSHADSGAFTGEISADMLLELGVEYVIIGHSERRQYFGETDATVNQKALKAISKGLKPIICVGESEAQKVDNKTNEVCSAQIKAAFANVSKADVSQCVVAYEPIWAIGTGKTATADDANDTIKYIRSVLAELYSSEIASTVAIQYGGSMNASNAAELLGKSDIDGGLIGGASLKSADFATIVKASQ